jgi:hypothetical protein
VTVLPNGMGPSYEGLPTPSWFHPETVAAFKALELRSTDVIICTYPKTGTTWMHKVCVCVHGTGFTFSVLISKLVRS